MTGPFNVGDSVKAATKDRFRGRSGVVSEVRNSNGPLAEFIGVDIPGETKTAWFWGYELKGVDDVEHGET